MKHRKKKHDNLNQRRIIFNPFPEELRVIREEMRAELPDQNRKKILADKAERAEAKDEWTHFLKSCTPRK